MAVTEPAIGSSNWGPVVNAALTQLDTIGPSAAYHTQTLAAPGAVAIDATTGQFQNVLLQAAPSSASISNPSLGQVLTLQYTQDATGGRSLASAWPANCKFAGGAAPNDTTASKSTSVTFAYDGTNWREIARAVAVG